MLRASPSINGGTVVASVTVKTLVIEPLSDGMHHRPSPGLILLVEDEIELRRLWRIALVLNGFEVEEAGDGIDALRRIEQRRPDLVVLDIGLPTLSGWSVQQEIAAHAQTSELPVVIVTGGVVAPGSAKVSCLLHKPVTPDVLVRTVQACLSSGAAFTRS